MSDFISRLRSIKRAAEEKAQASGADSGHGDTRRHAENFATFTKAIADTLLERCEKFRDEFPHFDPPRSLPLPGGQCVRLSLVEKIDEIKKVSRLTFTLEENRTEAWVRIVCKGIVWNRERGMHDLTAHMADPGADDALRLFAEERLLEFAEAFSDASLASA